MTFLWSLKVAFGRSSEGCRGQRGKQKRNVVREGMANWGPLGVLCCWVTNHKAWVAKTGHRGQQRELSPVGDGEACDVASQPRRRSR